MKTIIVLLLVFVITACEGAVAVEVDTPTIEEAPAVIDQENAIDLDSDPSKGIVSLVETVGFH